jgi:hypothetical protein
MNLVFKIKVFVVSKIWYFNKSIYFYFPKIWVVTLKSESGCKSYRIFCEDIFCRFRARFGPEIQRKSCRTIFLYFRFWLSLNQKFNREFNREFLVKPRIQPGIPVSPPIAIFGFPYKRGFFPNGFLEFLSMKYTSIVDPFELSSSLFPPMILAFFKGFERGDLDLQSPQNHSSSKSGKSFESRSWSHWLTSTLVLPL